MMVDESKLLGTDGPMSSVRRPETLAKPAEHIATSKMLATKDKSTSASEKGMGGRGAFSPSIRIKRGRSLPSVLYMHANHVYRKIIVKSFPPDNRLR